MLLFIVGFLFLFFKVYLGAIFIVGFLLRDFVSLGWNGIGQAPQAFFDKLEFSLQRKM